MAKKSVPQFLGLHQSLFRPNDRPGRNHMPTLGNVESEDEPVSNRRVIDSAFATFAISLCVKRRIDPSKTMEAAVSIILARAVARSVAWGWMLDEFLSVNPQFNAPKYEALVQHARWRVKAMKRKENRKIDKARLEREGAEAQKRYAAERKSNGGEFTFFNSAKWQRLRYQVLLASNGCCVLCGRSTREHGVILHVDHIKPRSRFPNLALERSNLQVLCGDCNLGKSNRDTTDWRPVPQNDDNPQEDAA